MKDALNQFTAAFANRPLALMKEGERGFYAMRAEFLMASEQERNMAAASGRKARTSGTVAVLPLHDLIMQRDSLMLRFFGGTSTEAFGQMFDLAMDDPSVSAIVIDVDSPGGTTNGVAELASKIFAARGKKPVLSISNGLMASAAAWIGMQADEVWATPSSDTGSIGVYTEHHDLSKRYEMEGIKTTIISAGDYKTELTDTAPLSQDAYDALKYRVDEIHDQFVKALAAGRKVSQKAVRDGFGKGRVFSAKDALAAGMVDKIGTLDEAIARAASIAQRQGRSNRAQVSVAEDIMVGVEASWRAVEALNEAIAKVEAEAPTPVVEAAAEVAETEAPRLTLADESTDEAQADADALEVLLAIHDRDDAA